MKPKPKQIIWAIILSLGLILFFATVCKTKTVLVPVDRVEVKGFMSCNNN